MAIRRWAGYPNLSGQMYVLDEIGSKQKPAERPDNVDQVFMIKLKWLLQDIVQEKRFGKTNISAIYNRDIEKRSPTSTYIDIT